MLKVLKSAHRLTLAGRVLNKVANESWKVPLTKEISIKGALLESSVRFSAEQTNNRKELKLRKNEQQKIYNVSFNIAVKRVEQRYVRVLSPPSKVSCNKSGC